MQYYRILNVDGKIDEHRLDDPNDLELYLNNHYETWEEAHILHYLRSGNIYDDIKYIIRKDNKNHIIWINE